MVKVNVQYNSAPEMGHHVGHCHRAYSADELEVAMGKTVALILPQS